LSFEHETNLFVLVQVLVEETLDLGFVVRQLLGTHGDDVVILVRTATARKTERRPREKSERLEAAGALDVRRSHPAHIC
jgi:hypothetical protein